MSTQIIVHATLVANMSMQTCVLCLKRLHSIFIFGGCQWKAVERRKTLSAFAWCRDVLVDFLGDPYPQAYQRAFRERRVTQLSLIDAQAECEGDAAAIPPTLPHALLQEPPTLTSAAWLAQVRFVLY